MGRLPVLFAIMICCHSAAADDPASNPSSANDEIARLLERIERLEKRVQELEGQSRSTPGATEAPQNQPYVPTVNPPYYSPNHPYIQNIPTRPQQVAPQVPRPLLPPSFSPPIQHFSPVEPNETVPKSWQPFNFNGQRYYVIPVNETERLLQRQRST